MSDPKYVLSKALTSLSADELSNLVEHTKSVLEKHTGNKRSKGKVESFLSDLVNEPNIDSIKNKIRLNEPKPKSAKALLLNAIINNQNNIGLAVSTPQPHFPNYNLLSKNLFLLSFSSIEQSPSYDIPFQVKLIPNLDLKSICTKVEYSIPYKSKFQDTQCVLEPFSLILAALLTGKGQYLRELNSGLLSSLTQENTLSDALKYCHSYALENKNADLHNLYSETEQLKNQKSIRAKKNIIELKNQIATICNREDIITKKTHSVCIKVVKNDNTEVILPGSSKLKEIIDIYTDFKIEFVSLLNNLSIGKFDDTVLY